jgi:hypothetical protein
VLEAGLAAYEGKALVNSVTAEDERLDAILPLVKRHEAAVIALPLYVGLAGPVDRARLLRMAARAGVAESARFAAGHTEWFLRAGVPGGYSPDRLLDRAGTALAAPESAVAGLHIFTFNQIRQAEQWRSALLARLDPLTPAAARVPAPRDHQA